MTRIFVDFIPTLAAVTEGSCAIGPELIELNSELTHHLRDVLRLDEGKQLTVVCRQSSHEYLAIIAEAQRDKLSKIQLIRSIDRSIPVPVVASLFCGLPKGSHADQICEQVTQLGVERILFWCADRSVAQPKQAASKLERWQKIAEASARQSKQNSIPKIEYLESSSHFYAWINNDIDLTTDMLAVCSLAQKAKPISSVQPPEGRVHLIVGPEGDFSSEEIKALDGFAAQHLSLGPLVLRVETAALAAVSMGLAQWGWR